MVLTSFVDKTYSKLYKVAIQIVTFFFKGQSLTSLVNDECIGVFSMLEEVDVSYNVCHTDIHAGDTLQFSGWVVHR